MKNQNVVLYLSILIGLVLMSSGCNNLEFSSNWLDREITIDGSDAEWQGSLMSLKKGKMAWGVLNDEKYLYITCVLSDREIERQVMGLGLTVWLNANGGTDKTFGIHFPIGMQDGRRQMMQGLEGGSAFDEEQFFQQGTSEMEIVGPGKDERFKTLAPGTDGIEVQLRRTSGRLVYELKVPLSISPEHPFAINTKPGNEIGIGFEVTEPSMKERPDDMPNKGGRSQGGMSGGGKKSQGKGISHGGNNPPESLKLWASVTLASPNAGVIK
ncbi:MAG: hypothetical protein Q8K98_09340 [Bacteroidota bacterium]|nr:hypothetical protein [Bacteroidota bacterium]